MTRQERRGWRWLERLQHPVKHKKETDIGIRGHCKSPLPHVVRKCSAEKLDLRREVMFSFFSAVQRSIFETLQAFSPSLARRMISSSGPD